MFLTVHAPIRPLEPSGVRTIVRNACPGADVERIPAHRLRHALASDLLREDASVVDISQVLRHNQLESTATYAKVDLQRLRLAACPWPGAIPMTTLTQYVEDYLRLRRALGFKLHEQARVLPKFRARR